MSTGGLKTLVPRAVLVATFVLGGCKAVYWVTPTGEGRAPIDAPPPPNATPPPPAVSFRSLREAGRWACEAAAPTGDNFCELQAIQPNEDGHALVAGSFRGRVRIGPHVLSSRGMQNALVLALEPNGAVSWVKQYGEQGHNVIRLIAPLSDGRFAVAGIAANGFHPALSKRPTPPNGGYAAERSFVGVLTPQGDWAWITDWPSLVSDLRRGPAGDFVVLDAARWTRLGNDGSILASRALAALPAGAIPIELAARAGATDCAWVLFAIPAPETSTLIARSSCSQAVSDWPLGSLVSEQSPLRLSASPDGESLYVVASETSAPGAQPSGHGPLQQTLWGLDARRGERFATRTWPIEDGALTRDHRSEPLALVAGGDTLDLLVGYQTAPRIGGVELPAAALPLDNGVLRAAVLMRFSAANGALLEAFTPPPVLGRDLALGLLSVRPVFSRGHGDAWFRGSATQSDGRLVRDQASISKLEAAP
jgi:hypothetical protein